MPHKCIKCNAHCCRHVAVHIDTPSSKKDYDNIRWYLLHENVWISIDHEGGWVLEFKTPCSQITPENNCSAYTERPRICREYPGDDELCEGETDQLSYVTIFKCPEDLAAYLDSRGVDWRYRKG